MFMTIPTALTFLLNKTRTEIATSIQTPVSCQAQNIQAVIPVL